jgi:hypothetical protein
MTDPPLGASLRGWQLRSLCTILVCFVLLAWAYGLIIPAFENLDEVEHFSAIRYVADTGSLPVHDPVIQEQYHYRQEASQPPLYYIVMGGLTHLLGLPTDDTNTYLVKNPFVACGPADHPYNRHALYHNPSTETFSFAKLGKPPWDGALLTLHILRGLAPLLQIITVVGVFAIARLTLPQHPAVAPFAAALTAFNPQFLSVASGVNNDNLVTPLVTLGLYLALVTRERGLSLRRSLALGVLTGLAGLSKLSGLLLLGLIGCIMLESAWRGGGWRRSIGHGLLIGVVAAATCGWWFWRNWQLYGDPTALEPMLQWVGQREVTTLPLNESGLMFRSFWGQLACAFFRDWFYAFFGLLTAVGLAGVFVGACASWRDRWQDRESWKGLLWLALWFSLVFAGWLRWGALTAATGGRLLFPAIASTSTLLAYGLLHLCPAAWRRRVVSGAVALLALVALATLIWELRPLFAPPRIYAESEPPVISHPLEATFGAPGQIGTRGYDVRIAGAAPDLDVTLYWQPLALISQDYALAIQLVSPVPGDNSLRLNYNTWPGRGNYPTTAWSPDQIIADHYRFKLPSSDALTQAWRLLVAFYELGSGERLPVRLNGQDVGNELILTTVRVPGVTPLCPGGTTLDQPVHFGQGDQELISLEGEAVDTLVEGAEAPIQVVLCWKSLALAPLDYTVFVHLYSGSGELLATGDGPPMNGAFPTSLWEPGDRIVDTHQVSLSGVSELISGSWRVGVGLYDLNSGERLQATRGGQQLPNNTLLLEP